MFLLTPVLLATRTQIRRIFSKVDGRDLMLLPDTDAHSWLWSVAVRWHIAVSPSDINKQVWQSGGLLWICHFGQEKHRANDWTHGISESTVEWTMSKSLMNDHTSISWSLPSHGLEKWDHYSVRPWQDFSIFLYSVPPAYTADRRETAAKTNTEQPAGQHQVLNSGSSERQLY